MYTSSVLTTAEHTPLTLPTHIRPQYLVSVDPMDKPALDVAHFLWSSLPGTVRVLPRGMVYFSGLEPKHLEMFSGVTVIDDRRPAKTIYVGQEPFPEVVVHDDGKRTVVPIDPTIVIVKTPDEAAKVANLERVNAAKARMDEEEQALKQKIFYYCGVVGIFVLVAVLVWRLS